MSASRKNPNTTRAYRERAQPHSRSKHGLLEKHKDYKLRAADHNEKKRKLRALQQKASERNADEFYFGMMSSKTDTKSGRRQQDDGGRGNTAMSEEVVRLLKTQDAGYLRTMLQRARRERERLEEEILVVENEDGGQLQALREGAIKTRLDSDADDFDVEPRDKLQRSNHIVFVEDETEQDQFNAEEWFGTDEKGLAQTYNRPRRHGGTVSDRAPSATDKPKKTLSAEAEKAAWKEMRRQQKKRALAQEQRLARLAAVKERETSLMTAERELDLQRAKMGNSIGGVNKYGIKFKPRERKR